MGILRFGKQLLQRLDRNEALGMSAELAYFFLLSLFPFLIFVLTLIAYVPITQEDVLGVIRQYAPGESMRLIETNVSRILNEQRGDHCPSGLSLPFGLHQTVLMRLSGLLTEHLM